MIPRAVHLASDSRHRQGPPGLPFVRARRGACLSGVSERLFFLATIRAERRGCVFGSEGTRSMIDRSERCKRSLNIEGTRDP